MVQDHRLRCCVALVHPEMIQCSSFSTSTLGGEVASERPWYRTLRGLYLRSSRDCGW
ncbi:hypothetical protein BDP55DRAFT_687474 [Colletotrichum godetiae]|uniref:Uncharacterized protein n=1 Tax=Colletotrichum godetiae TaxID=1209918 RepID=A0AAJ0EPF4_9PEZI|nr:uncharacterized protein BDP55DRAFT_688684 [Colletotrichum godetiae]XP_060421706.1 uncharacterized protein BDP55DRAFT_687474 [Colletotrichum godetiae]KAK1656554.1 hypothetical protein BDP55DRAFT_688684 [Colletotrichum godetiae]KAK1656942.1 hypothetical protein BDP55DRAFT_687474 [Colletotrichum godetiae]